MAKTDSGDAQGAPRFIVLEKSLIGNRIHEAGDEVTLPEGTLPAANLAPTCTRGEALKDDYERSNKDRVDALRKAHPEPGMADADTLKKFIDQLAKQNQEQQATIAAAVAAGVTEGIQQLLAAGLLSVAAPPAPATAPAPATPASAADPKGTAAPAPAPTAKKG